MNWLLVFVQVIFALIAVFVGWELLILVIEPSGNNWMWQMEMRLFFGGLTALIICSALIVRRLGITMSRIRISGIVQVILLVLWYFLGRDVFPYRNLFLLFCGIITVSIPIISTYFSALTKILPQSNS